MMLDCGFFTYRLQSHSLIMMNPTPNPPGSNPSQGIKRKHPGTTELAKKYTAPRTGQHNALIGFEPLKSGITPLEPAKPYLTTWRDFMTFMFWRGTSGVG